MIIRNKASIVHDLHNLYEELGEIEQNQTITIARWAIICDFLLLLGIKDKKSFEQIYGKLNGVHLWKQTRL
jgi:hypothetical protein